MCIKVECKICEKVTWKGCGRHIEQALKDVPEDQRCQCVRVPPVDTIRMENKPKQELTTTENNDNED